MRGKNAGQLERRRKGTSILRRGPSDQVSQLESRSPCETSSAFNESSSDEPCPGSSADHSRYGIHSTQCALPDVPVPGDAPLLSHWAESHRARHKVAGGVNNKRMDDVCPGRPLTLLHVPTLPECHLHVRERDPHRRGRDNALHLVGVRRCLLS